MNLHFIYVHAMRIFPALLPGLLLLAGTTPSSAQTVPIPAATPDGALAQPALPPAVPNKLLLKVGLNAGRALRWGGYYGATARLPVSVGAEYALSPAFTVYGQLDSDFRLTPRSAYFGDRGLAIPTGALGVGGRYYYNQAGRARHNRAHGPFIGNYLALEAHTELKRGYGNDLHDDFTPSLHAVWGLQRRLSRSFLVDFNVGAGLSPHLNDVFTGYSTTGLNITTQFNLGIYFGR